MPNTTTFSPFFTFGVNKDMIQIALKGSQKSLWSLKCEFFPDFKYTKAMVSRDAYGPRWSSLHQCSTCCSSSLPSLCTATSTRRWDFLVGFETPSSQVIPKTKQRTRWFDHSSTNLLVVHLGRETLDTSSFRESGPGGVWTKTQVSSFHPKSSIRATIRPEINVKSSPNAILNQDI